VFEATFPHELIPDTTFVRIGAARENNTSGGPEWGTCFAQDWESAPDEAGRAALVAVAQGQPLFGKANRASTVDGPAFDADIAESYVDYAGRRVRITLTAPLPEGSELSAGSKLLGIVDYDALFEYPDSSPYLFNPRVPSVYNDELEARGSQALRMDASDRFLFHGATLVYHPSRGALSLGGVRSLRGSVGGNRQSFCSGLLLVHAQHFDPYKYAQGYVQQGKGTGNMAWLMIPPGGDAQANRNLFLHETAHCLMLMHAQLGRMKHLHADSLDRACVLSYQGPGQNIGELCGKCLAHLMGVHIHLPQLTPADKLLGPAELHDAGEPPFEEVD
jgi:hypothetical protein